MLQAPESRLLGKNLYFHFCKAEVSNTYYCKEEIKIMNFKPTAKGRDKMARIYLSTSQYF